MTTPKTEWRDEECSLVRHEDDGFFHFKGPFEESCLSPTEARFLLRVLPEALGYRETPRVSDAIADRFGAGDSIAELAANYDITPEAAEACVRVERQADAAIVEAAENLEHHPMSPGAMLRLLETVRAKRSALNK